MAQLPHHARRAVLRFSAAAGVAPRVAPLPLSAAVRGVGVGGSVPGQAATVVRARRVLSVLSDGVGGASTPHRARRTHARRVGRELHRLSAACGVPLGASSGGQLGVGGPSAWSSGAHSSWHDHARGFATQSDDGEAASGAAAPAGKGFDVDEALDAANAAAGSGADTATAAVVEQLATDVVMPSMIEGYGPTALVMRAIDYFHMAGLPWWGAIVATTLIFRAAVMPLFYYGILNGARMQKIQPQLKDIQERMAKAKSMEKDQSREYILALNAERKAVMKKNNTSLSKGFLPVLVQLPFFVVMMSAIRGFIDLAAVEGAVQGWTSGGLAWWSNLSEKDPYISLPLLGAAFTLATVEINPNIQDNAQFTAKKMKMLFRGMGVLFIPLTMVLPAGIHVYIATTGFTMLIQTGLLNFQSFRNMIGLPKEWPMKVNATGVMTSANPEYVSHFHGLKAPPPPPPPSGVPPDSPLAGLPTPPPPPAEGGAAAAASAAQPVDADGSDGASTRAQRSEANRARRRAKKKKRRRG